MTGLHLKPLNTNLIIYIFIINNNDTIFTCFFLAALHFETLEEMYLPVHRVEDQLAVAETKNSVPLPSLDPYLGTSLQIRS